MNTEFNASNAPMLTAEGISFLNKIADAFAVAAKEMGIEEAMKNSDSILAPLIEDRRKLNWLDQTLIPYYLQTEPGITVYFEVMFSKAAEQGVVDKDDLEAFFQTVERFK